MSRAFAHPPIQSHQHHRHHHPEDRRLMLKARHRYEQPLMFPIDMSNKYHYRDRDVTVTGRGRGSSNFIGDMLKLHNSYRARHCAQPLTISRQLNQIAQSYAEHLAATSTFEHSGNRFGDRALGENLYMQWISRGNVKTSPKAAAKSWYDEIALYDYSNPTYSSETGHFTQMVWKATRLLGVGVAYSPDRREVYVVTNYLPAGNIVSPGYFQKNVAPPNC